MVSTVALVVLSPTVSHADALSNTVSVGGGPSSVLLTPDGSHLYVANYDTDNVYVIQTSNNTVVSTIAVGDGPWGLAQKPDGSEIYVTNYLGHSVSAIASATNTVIWTTAGIVAPNGIAVSPNGSFLFVATNDTTRKVTVLSTSSHAITGSSNLSTGVLADVKISPDGLKLYVADRTANVINVLDLNTYINTQRAVGNDPLWMALSADGSKIYVTENASHQFQVISTASWTIDATVSMGAGSGPWGIALNSSEDRIYVANSTNNSVDIYRVSDNSLLGHVAAGSSPWGVDVGSGNVAYVSAFQAHSVGVIKPAVLSMSSSTVSGAVGSSLTTTAVASNFTPSTTVTRTVTPALPSGLSLNSTTGVISGTPTAAQAATTYTISATDGTWTASTTVSIAVSAVSVLPSTGLNTVSFWAMGALAILTGLTFLYLRRKLNAPS